MHIITFEQFLDKFTKSGISCMKATVYNIL